jgi:serine/threonine protein kinase
MAVKFEIIQNAKGSYV